MPPPILPTPCASPHPTDPPGAGFPAWCGKSNPLLYCPDAQTLVMKCGTARRIPSGSTNCIVCKPHPFSCFLTVLFSALYVPFCQPGTAGCPTPASHVSVEVTHDPVCASVVLRVQKQALLTHLTLFPVTAVTTFELTCCSALGYKSLHVRSYYLPFYSVATRMMM